MERFVETVFSVVDRASTPMKAITSSATAASAAVAGSMSGMQFAIGGLLSGAAAHEIIALGSAFEDMSLNIAGNLSAFGVVSNISDGMEVAADLMGTINDMSARLPGSAEEYLQVFNAALPDALAAGMQDLQDIARMTSNLTAIGRAAGIDAMQLGGDVSRMLQGVAGMDVRLWRTMAPHLRSVAHDLHMTVTTAQQFNALKPEKRVQLMQAAVARFGPQLDAASETWSAIYGTSQQLATQIGRDASAPLFQAAKAGLNWLNGAVAANQQRIIALGQTISTKIVSAFKRVLNVVYQLRSSLAGIQKTEWYGNIARMIAQARRAFGAGGIGEMKSKVASKDTGDTGIVRRAAISGASLAAGSLAGGGPLGNILVGSAVKFATHTNEFAKTINNIATIGTVLAGGFARMAFVLDGIYTVGGNLMAGVLPGLSSGLLAFSRYFTNTVTMVAGLFGHALTRISDSIQPALKPIGSMFSALGGALGRLFELSNVTLMAQIYALGEGIAYVVQLIVPGLTWLTDTVTAGIARFNAFYDYIHEVGQAVYDVIRPSFDTVSDVLSSTMSTVRSTLTDVYSSVASFFSQALTTMAGWLTGVGNAFQWFGAKMVEIANMIVNALKQVPMIGRYITGGLETRDNLFSGASNAFNAMQASASSFASDVRAQMERNRTIRAAEAAEVARNAAATAEQRRRQAQTHRSNVQTPSARGGGNTHNDYRFSRFLIDQKFSDVDPDRIAVAFTNDLERLANRRLQSSMEPIFGMH